MKLQTSFLKSLFAQNVSGMIPGIVKLEKGAEDCVRMKADGTMNDALCDLTWAGPKRQNIKMGYICEMPTNDRKRRSSNNGVPQACQVEYRTRRGAVESIRMNCKEWISKQK